MSGNKVVGCSVLSKKTDSRTKRTFNDTPARQGQTKDERRFVRPASRGSERNWKPLVESTPSKLKRSVSLISIDNKSSGRESLISGGSGESLEEDQQNSLKQDALRWKVLYSFSRNLSRKRKQQIDSLLKQQEINDEAISKLNIQISLLKSIIRSDETIRDSWKKRFQDMKHIMATAINENNKLKDNFEDVTLNIEKLKEKISVLELENNNYKNSQIYLKSECSTLELKLNKERELNAMLRHESQLQANKANSELRQRSEENKVLKNQMEEFESCLELKCFALAEVDCNLQNTTRLWQNSVKEIHQLNREGFELRKENSQLKDEMISLKKSMRLLETNQEQIYKYFNTNLA